MKSKKLTCVMATIVLVALAVPIQVTAQHTRYTVIDLGTLGGTFSIGFAINNKGSVTGFSTTLTIALSMRSCGVKGFMTDLGTLGGINSIARDQLNERDQVAGRAETSTSDPLVAYT